MLSLTVAVVIPTYNHARHLAGAIDSVLGQSAPPDEIIVVDDGSHDAPEDVVSRYPAARLIRQPNKGLAAARNTGWRASRSDLLVFLDADDRLTPDAIALNLALFQAAPDSGLVYGAYREVFTATGEEHVIPVRDPGPDPFAAFLRDNCIGMHGTVMYPRPVLEALGGFDETLRACEDYDLYLRVARRFPMASQRAVLAEYVRHDDNMSRNAGNMLRSALRALRKQRQAANERAEWRRAFREGEAGWARFYADHWRRALLRASTTREFVHFLMQGLIIFRLAPLAIPADLLGRLRRRARRLRGRRLTAG